MVVALSRSVSTVAILVPAALLLAIFILFNGAPFRCNGPGPRVKEWSPPLFEENDEEEDKIGASQLDITWVKDQMQLAKLGDPPKTAAEWAALRKGINPRTREQQLFDLRRYHGISHYEDESESHTRLPCPGELLVEQHHSNYGEPWAGGRDVFEFLVHASSLKKSHRVLEIGCGTLRVGHHFIRYLKTGHYHCLERDELSLMAAFLYELPAQGLLSKRPTIVRTDNMNLTGLGSGPPYDLVYASAVFLHMPGDLVWTGLESLTSRMNPDHGRLFVSHNIKFCTRLGEETCKSRLVKLGLHYDGKHTHDSLLFNHYEIWHGFSRVP